MKSALHMPAVAGLLRSLFDAGVLLDHPEVAGEARPAMPEAEMTAKSIRARARHGRSHLASRGLSDHLLRDLGM
jgi:hypothetical protein